MSVDEPANKAVPHDELCDDALEHYKEISDVESGTRWGPEAIRSHSLIPKAIEFYKAHYVRRGERKIISIPQAQSKLDELADVLNKGWMFDPWLNPRGRIISTAGESPGNYWILVKGTPEQVAFLNPFVELEEEAPEPEKPLGYVAVKTEYIPYDKEGKPSREAEAGFVIMHKDHIYAKGTVYTLLPTASEA